MSVEIIVPSPGESVSEVTIANWLKKEGEWVNMDDPIAEMESDKATFEVNASQAGVIEKLSGNVGDTIAVGAVIAVINTTAEKPAGAPEKPAVEKPKEKEVFSTFGDLAALQDLKKKLEEAGAKVNLK